ncbi:hypothetical protein [Rhodococcus rhodochrous]|uniref:hypothetical protein n=1 Tax=Rhodococcus rhodochrous TaxID=1829 RepID=UPI0002DF5ADD|nr:hypothetical protein [Rhodococcus rhodochrous]
MTDLNTTVDFPARLLIQAAILKELKSAADVDRRAAAEALQPGDKKAPRHAGVKLGTVSLSDPDPEPMIENPIEFDAWIREHRPDLVQAPAERIIKGGMGEAIEVLKAHAPHLVVTADVGEIPDWAITQALRDAIADGELPDGVELREKTPTLLVRPSKDAVPLVRSILEGHGLLAIDGGES